MYDQRLNAILLNSTQPYHHDSSAISFSARPRRLGNRTANLCPGQSRELHKKWNEDLEDTGAVSCHNKRWEGCPCERLRRQRPYKQKARRRQDAFHDWIKHKVVYSY